MTAINGWEKTPFGEIAALVKGVSYASEDYCEPGQGAIFLTIKCVSKAGGFKPEGIKYFKGKVADSQELHAGDLLIANTDLTRAGDIVGAPIVVPLLNDETVTMSMDLSRIVEDDRKIDRRFLYFVLMADSVRRFMKDHASGSTVLHLQTHAVPTLEIEIPSKKLEQTKIAEILSTVDQAIEQMEALIAKQQRIKTGLMQDLLTRGIDENGNLRSEETHKFKDSPLGRIPVEWEIKEIGGLLADVNPPMRSGPFGSALLKEELLESGIPLLGIDNVFPEKFVPFFKRFVAPEKARQLKQFRVRPRDIMITIMGTVGRCCMVPNDIGEALSSKHVWTISFDEKVYSPYLACIQINYSPWVLNHFAKDMQGGIMEAIRAETLRSTRLPVPPLDEMREIENRLRAMSTGIGTNQAVLRKLIRIKTGSDARPPHRQGVCRSVAGRRRGRRMSTKTRVKTQPGRVLRAELEATRLRTHSRGCLMGGGGGSGRASKFCLEGGCDGS